MRCETGWIINHSFCNTGKNQNTVAIIIHPNNMNKLCALVCLQWFQPMNFAQDFQDSFTSIGTIIRGLVQAKQIKRKTKQSFAYILYWILLHPLLIIYLHDSQTIPPFRLDIPSKPRTLSTIGFKEVAKYGNTNKYIFINSIINKERGNEIIKKNYHNSQNEHQLLSSRRHERL